MATNDDRITALAQSIYVGRHGVLSPASGTALTSLQDQTIEWVNQLIPEIQQAKDPVRKPVYWRFVRTNNNSIGTITNVNTVSYALPTTVRTLVITPHRDLTIQQGGIVISTFKLVNPNQILDPNDTDVRSRATVIGRNVVFSRPLNSTELNGTIVADSVAPIPQLSHADVSLLDILDANLDIRQLFVLGVLKNQALPDIVQGGLTPSFAGKFNSYLQDCITDNNLSADADDQDREDLGNITGVF